MAGILVILLVAVAIRRRHPQDEKDVSLADSLTLNPVYSTSKSHDQFTIAPRAMGVAITRVANPKITPAALTQRGDRLWADFRRCAAFDHMYFGNKLLDLLDDQLEDVYVAPTLFAKKLVFFERICTCCTHDLPCALT